MKQNIVATAIVDVNVKNIETGASAPVVIVPSVVEGVTEVGMNFIVSVLGPNKVKLVKTEMSSRDVMVPKGTMIMSGEDIKKKFSGFRIFRTSEEGTFTGVFFGEGLDTEANNAWLRWLGLLAQESCKALWGSVVELCKEFKEIQKERGFLEAIKSLWKKFVTWAKARCQALWETLVSLWDKFMGLFKKANEIIQEPIVAPEVVA